MDNAVSDWLSEWKERYPREIRSWDAQYPDVDREYVTFYPCDVQRLDPDEMLTKSAEKGEKIHLYVHIPFCKYLCPFCFFNKYPYDVDKAEAYTKALKREIYYYSRKRYLQNCVVVSVYFGGGTPTVLSPNQIFEILQHIRKCFNVSKDAEITVESTPVTVNEGAIKDLAMSGINRISIGVQSFNDALLQQLYLRHKREQCKSAIRAVKDSGIDVGIDLMYRLPCQTLSDWEKDLSVAVDLNVDTISCYSLELPPPTKEKFFSKVSLPDLEEDVKMYYFAIDYLKDNDYRQYTVADFSMPHKESNYVLNCWKAPQDEYLAFGTGAHSFIGENIFYNIASLEYYFEWVEKERLPILFGKKMTKEEAMSRYFVLGVKCLSVDLQRFERIFGIEATELYGDIFNSLAGKGLIKVSETLLELTRKGLIYVDNISKSFYTQNNRGKPQPVGILLQNTKPTDLYQKGDAGAIKS